MGKGRGWREYIRDVEGGEVGVRGKGVKGREKIKLKNLG